jgi:hypothetical protein
MFNQNKFCFIFSENSNTIRIISISLGLANQYPEYLYVTTIITEIFMIYFFRLEQFYCTSQFDFQSGQYTRESALTRLWALIRQGTARPLRT